MRVIVVDNDSTMLEATVRALREHFVIDAVTNKADCIDLLRQNEFDIIVACERLEDGSGLELLGQVAKRWPATLRVFAADRERLRLLQGKLGPFELFQALSYPINPDKLLATLSLAREAHEAHADTTTIQHIVLGGDDPPEAAPEPPPPPPPPAPAPRAKSVGTPTRPAAASSAPRQPNSPGRAQTSTLASVRGPMNFDASFALGSSSADSPARKAPVSSAPGASAARTSSVSPAPPSPARTSAASSAPPSPARTSAATSAPPSPARASSTNSSPQPSSARAWSGRTFAGPGVPAGNSAPRALTQRAVPADSLAEAASIAAAARSRLEPEESGTPTHRKAFIAGAGCAVALFVIGFFVLEFRSEPTLTPTPPPPIPQAPQYAKPVTDQVTEVETDFETDDFKKAQDDVRKLQAMAPDHPRLQFFRTLIDRGLKTHAVAVRDSAVTSKSGAQRKLTASDTRSDAAPAGTAAAQSTASVTPSKPALASTFSGRTIEESTSNGTGTAGAAPADTNAVAADTVHAAGTAADTLSSNASTTPATSTALPGAASSSTAAGSPDGAPATAAANAANAPTSAAAPNTAPASAPTGAAGTATSSAADEPRQAPHSAIPVVTAEAQLTRRVPPDYPDSAMRKGIQGYVDVHFTITAQGAVTNVAVVSSDPGEVFDRAATDAVRRWRYDPRVVDGQAVDSQSQVRLQFRLDQSLSH